MAKAAAVRAKAQAELDARRKEEAEERRDRAELLAIVEAPEGEAPAPVAAGGRALAVISPALSAALAAAAAGTASKAPVGQRLRLKKVVRVFDPSGKEVVGKMSEQLIVDNNILKAYAILKQAGSDVGELVDAVLRSEGPGKGHDALPAPLRGSVVAPTAGRHLDPTKADRREREAVKREKRKLAAAAEQYEKVKTEGAAALQSGVGGPGGIISLEEGTLKMKMFRETGLEVAQKLDARVRTSKPKPSKSKKKIEAVWETLVEQERAKKRALDEALGGEGAEADARRAAAAAAEAAVAASRQANAVDLSGQAVRNSQRQDEVRKAVDQGRKADVARFALNDVLLKCLNRVAQKNPAYERHFLHPVNALRPTSKDYVPDYAAKTGSTTKSELQSISKMRNKCQAVTADREYRRPGELLHDASVMAHATRAYHAPKDGSEPGAQANKLLGDLAEQFEAQLREEVESRAEDIKAAIAKGGAGGTTAPRMPHAPVQRVGPPAWKAFAMQNAAAAAAGGGGAAGGPAAGAAAREALFGRMT